ncbi:MAG: 5'-nucleotidase [Gelidibacter sp.]
MNLKNLFLVFGLLFLASCKTDTHLYKIEGKNITITDSLRTDVAIDNFIKPYRDHLNKSMDSVLAYSANTYTKSDGELNTAIGNLMADIVYEESNPVFKKRTGNDIDFVLLNYGGIRSIISKGPITMRTAFEMMPFENSVVVAKLNGTQIKEMLDYLANAKRAHPISHLKIVLDKNGKVASASVKNQAIDFNKSYYVATNDYLYNGGDHMDFFKPSDTLYVLNYKIRNAIIDYFKKVDTIKPVIDDRFIQFKN